VTIPDARLTVEARFAFSRPVGKPGTGARIRVGYTDESLEGRDETALRRPRREPAAQTGRK
jgi:hypothetical protein